MKLTFATVFLAALCGCQGSESNLSSSETRDDAAVGDGHLDPSSDDHLDTSTIDGDAIAEDGASTGRDSPPADDAPDVIAREAAGDEQPYCPGSCCMGVDFWTPGSVNPDNRCQICDPAVDLHSWSPREDCGPQCSCATGMPAETECDNGVDDDQDHQRDCADADCDGKPCQRLDPFATFPTKTVHSTDGGHPSNHLVFGGLPATWTATIYAATLDIDYRVPGTSPPVHADIRALQNPSQPICSADLNVTPDTSSLFPCDVTTVVQGWNTSHVPQNERVFILTTTPYGTIEIGTIDQLNRLVIDYHPTCTAGVCPRFE